MNEITMERLTANMEQGPADLEYHIEGVLPVGGRIAAVGLSGHGKSTLLLHQALHVTTGKDWMGHPTRPSSVLWLNLNDEPRDVVYMRERLLGRGMGLDAKPENLILVSQSEWPDQPFGMHSGDRVRNTFQLIDTCQPDILVIDSLRRFLPFKDQVMIVRPLHELTSHYPMMTQYYIHHAQQKGITATQLLTDEDPASYFANSSDLARDVDAFFVVKAFKRDERLERIVLRAVSKRFLVLPKPIQIDVQNLRRAQFSPNHYGEPTGPSALVLVYGGLYAPELPLEQKHILDVLAKNAGDYGMSVRELVNASETAIALTTTYRHIEKLYEAGWIELVSRGDRGKRFYRVTAEGMKNLPAL